MKSPLFDALRDIVPAARVTEEGERPLVHPQGDAEWSAVLRFATERDAKVLVRGANTRHSERPDSTQVEFVCSTTGDSGVTAYEPGDGVVTARAGTTFEMLRQTIAQGGHHLTPLFASGAGTLGGALASGHSGADRLRFGPLRHHVLGAKIAFGDGTVTQSGGSLVKNVTGYDLFRLWTGSHGAFGVLLEVSLRLFAAPQHTECATIGGLQRAAALELSRKLARTAQAPLAIELHSEELYATWTLLVVHAGPRALVDAAWEQARVVAPDLGDVHSPKAWVREPVTPAILRLTSRPRAFESALETLLGTLDLESPATLLRPAIGEALIGLNASAAELLELERRCATLDLDVQWRRAPDSVLRHAQAREMLAPGFAVMRRLRERYDPAQRFAPGRFFGGL